MRRLQYHHQGTKTLRRFNQKFESVPSEAGPDRDGIEIRNSKWFDRLTILSKAEGQIQMRIRTLLTGVTKIQNSKPATDFRIFINRRAR